MKHKVLIIILVLILAALACSTLTENSTTTGSNLSATSESLAQTQAAMENVQQIPESAVQPDPPSEDVSAALTQSGAEGALLAYDSSIWGELHVEVVAAAQEDMYQTPHPRHVQFATTDGMGVISMVPVYSYSLVFDEAPELFSDLDIDLNYFPEIGYNCITELPIRDFYHVCAHQEFVASPAYLSFSNGAGVRFVTNYGIQDITPVDNANLRYMFQGLTSDGQCYLSIEFNLSHSSLPEVGSIPEEVYSDMSGESISVYFENIAYQLSEDEAGYTPALRSFDALIESLEVLQCGVNQ